MEPANDLIGQIVSAKAIYNDLLIRYNEFVAQITALLTGDDRLNDIVITQNQDNSLTIKFLDRELLAKFSFSINNGNRVGSINCYLMPTETEAEIRNIHSFTFTANGETNIPVQNDNDPYEIHNHRDAVNILAHWLRESLNKNS
jgi:hypothetical protein